MFTPAETSPIAPTEQPQPSNPSVPTDPATVIEQKIKTLMESLNSVVTEVSKEKQISNRKIEEISTQFKMLSEIEFALEDQLDVMQECLMAADFNACRPLNDHEIETYEEMEDFIKIMVKNLVNPNYLLSYEYDEPEYIHSSNDDDISESKRVFTRDPTRLDTSGHQSAFVEAMNKRFLEVDAPVRIDSDEQDEDGNILVYRDEEALKVKAMLRVLQNEGWLLNEREQQWLQRDEKSPKEYENEELWDPSFDEVGRIMEHLIRRCKDKFKIADNNYKLAKRITTLSQDAEQLEILSSERKRVKVLLKQALEVRNEICKLTSNDLKQRHQIKVEKNLEKAICKADEEIQRIQMRAKGFAGLSELHSNPSPPPEVVAAMKADDNNDESELPLEENLADNFIVDGVEYTYGKHVVKVDPEPSDANDADTEMDVEDMGESRVNRHDDKLEGDDDLKAREKESVMNSPKIDPESTSGTVPEKMDTN